MLQPLDIAIILGWLSLTFVAGLWFSKRGSTSTDDFFVADRSLPWWVIGTSMVATTFAADTPLAVSGYVAAAGIGDNWKWWFTGVGALCTVFLFARLWRRAEVVTEAELVELRYGGVASQVLRAVKALWFGVFMNMLVVAWVMRAMRKVVEVVLGIGPEALIWGIPTSVVIVVVLFCLAVAYTGSAGLWGVVATDVVQFVLAMTGSIILAVLSWRAAGGLEGIQESFLVHGFDWTTTTTLVPLNDPSPDGATLKFVLLMGVMWWAARNVDGGSYLAQRLFSAKDENHALWGYLWFTVANICVRPWPWIIVGLCGMAVLGPLEDPETYYPRMMVEVLPAGLFGLLVASFLAAFMSTIDTQLHWGASLLINDIYRRFLKPHAPDAHMLTASRVAVGLLAIVGAVASFIVEDIRFAWELALAITAGIGAVNIGRWYWWRVNAYSEFAAMGMAALGTLGFKIFRTLDVAQTLPQGWLSFPFDAVAITAVSLPVWITVTLLTPPGERAHLRAFYRRVRPGGPGWRAVAGDIEGFENDGPGRGTFLGIAAGCVGIYGVLLGMGSAIVGRWHIALIWGVLAAIATLITARQVARETARNT
jgi:solute:Na+ symporter, SSS family